MQEKIEVGYRNLGSAAGVDYHHKFILYTDSTGQKHTISGWTGPPAEGLPYGRMQVETNLPYNASNPDHPDSLNTKAADGTNQRQYRETIAEGDDLSGKWKEMIKDAAAKGDKFPYDPLRQNSNTLADSVLHDAGLPGPQNDGLTGHLAPASHLALDKKLVPRDPAQQALTANLSDLVSAARPVEANAVALPDKKKEEQRMHALLESPLFKEARTAMQKLDVQYARASDQYTDNAAAAVAVAAQHAGMTRIDLLEPHGNQLIAVQGKPGTVHSKVVAVPAVQALNTPITESAETFAQQAQQAPQTVPSPVQQQHRSQQQAQPAPVMTM